MPDSPGKRSFLGLARRSSECTDSEHINDRKRIMKMKGTLYMKKYNYIDSAKVIAMFLVILFHGLLFFSDSPYWLMNADYKNKTAIFLCNILNYTVVPLFVFCSGFLLQVSMQNKELRTGTAIKKRIKRLLLPYIIYRALWLVPTYTLFDIPVYGRPKGSSLIDRKSVV